jgi:hypothetical protein
MHFTTDFICMLSLRDAQLSLCPSCNKVSSSSTVPTSTYASHFFLHTRATSQLEEIGLESWEASGVYASDYLDRYERDLFLRPSHFKNVKSMTIVL